MAKKDDRMYNITPEILRNIAGAPVSKNIVDGLVENLPETLEKYNINTRLRIAHFLAQLAHESDHFRTFEEYASGAGYEGRRDLGNVVRGDGKRYKGRGPIQITGRYNYRKYGKILGVDLENNPHLAATPRLGTLIAGEYWHQNDLNQWADRDNGKQITRKINGGYNGLKDRLEKIERAKKALASAEIIRDLPSRYEEPDKVEVVNETPEKIESLPTFVQLNLLENSND
jgi:putative chitinase